MFQVGAKGTPGPPTRCSASVCCGAESAERIEEKDDLPFVFLTLLFLALPALAVLVLAQRATAVLPKVRDWMDANSWIVSEIVLVFFIAIVLFG